MSYPHRIRLRGPWDYEVLARDGPRGSLRLPGRWAEGPLAGVAGWVQLRRAFGYPGQIDPDERVFLTIDAAAGCRAVEVNEASGPAVWGPSYEWDVTALVRARNQLRLVVDGDREREGLPGEVALEVRRTAWLRSLRLERGAAGPRVTGEVIGAAPGPLDLYLIIDRGTAAQAVVNASGNGEPFCLESTGEGRLVTVDLVLGAVVWYRWQQEA